MSSSRATIEEFKALWGEEFFNICYKEAEEVRAKICPDWIYIIPVDLVLAAAIRTTRLDLARKTLNGPLV